MTTRYDSHDGRATLRDLIKGIHVAMLTTVDEDGFLRSRPMGNQGLDDGGRLTFFTNRDSSLVQEATHSPVSVAFADTAKGAYVSISGHAQLCTDPAEIRALWKPEYNAWFEGGADDPAIALLHVTILSGEYWKTPGGPLTKLAELTKAATGNHTPSLGQHAKI